VGATTGYVTAILIGHTAESPKAATEVFVADSDHGAADDAGGGAIWTNVVWIAPGKLAIAHASKARVFKHLPSAKGASITYRASDPLYSRWWIERPPHRLGKTETGPSFRRGEVLLSTRRFQPLRVRFCL